MDSSQRHAYLRGAEVGSVAGELPGFAQLAPELTQAGQPGCEGCGHPSLCHKLPKGRGLKLHLFMFCSQTCRLGKALCGLLLSAVCSVSWGGSRMCGVRVT